MPTETQIYLSCVSGTAVVLELPGGGGGGRRGHVTTAPGPRALVRRRGGGGVWGDLSPTTQKADPHRFVEIFSRILFPRPKRECVDCSWTDVYIAAGIDPDFSEAAR